MNTPLMEALRKVEIFAGLEDALLQPLVQHSRRRKFPAGETLFHEGDPGHTLYIILSGDVNILKPTMSGDPVHIARLLTGAHFGEMALLDGKPRMADAVTASPCELLMLDRTAFLDCIATCPQMALNIMTSLADRLRQSALLLQSHQELDVLGRVSMVLLKLLNTHGEDDPAGGRRIATRLTQQQLAEQVGASRETVNRTLNSLKATHAIRADSRAIVVLNEQKLRQCCELD